MKDAAQLSEFERAYIIAMVMDGGGTAQHIAECSGYAFAGNKFAGFARRNPSLFEVSDEGLRPVYQLSPAGKAVGRQLAQHVVDVLGLD